jgi:hypothetical protein
MNKSPRAAARGQFCRARLHEELPDEVLVQPLLLLLDVVVKVAVACILCDDVELALRIGSQLSRARSTGSCSLAKLPLSPARGTSRST